MTHKQIWFTAESGFNPSEAEVMYHILNPIGSGKDADAIILDALSSLQSDFDADIAALFKVQAPPPSKVKLVKAVDIAGPLRYLSKVVSGDLEIDWGFVPQMVMDFQPREFDLLSYDDSPTARYLLQVCHVRSAVCVPIGIDGVVKGFYSLLFDQVRSFAEEKSQFLIMVGVALAALLEFCSLLERLDALEQRSAALGSASEAVGTYADALRNLLDGIEQIAAKASRVELSQVEKSQDMAQNYADLSQGELSVLALVAAGFSNEEIAKRLYISEGTVKKRIGSIMAKLGLKNRTQLGVYYARCVR